MALSSADAKLLWGRAAGHCSNPACRKKLTASKGDSDLFHFGEHAHVIADSPAGPRGTADGRVDTDAYENHLLLCPTCHTMVDKNPQDHPVEQLRIWKDEHEQWVDDQLLRALRYVSFEELETVCDGIVASRVDDAAVDLTLTPPLEKMEKNGLTTRTHRVIQMGLSQAGHIRAFLEDMEEVDPSFPDRLVDGFQREYHLALADGLAGDELFQHLATHHSADVALQASQLAVTSYLFHACDLFES